MRLQAIPSRLITKSKQIYYRNSNSAPFLSGDLFADSSDISFYGQKYRKTIPSLREIKDARVVFCPSHFLERLLEDYDGLLSAKVLILGNSDRDFDTFNFKLPPSIKQVFAQNVTSDFPGVRLLPIGIENLRLGKNGELSLFQHPTEFEKKSEYILLGPFKPTHSERDFYFKDDAELPANIVKITKRVSPNEYAQLTTKYRFVATPRGKGMDTHRFWETLYRGSVPIVLANSWAVQVAKLGIPMIQIAEWNPKILSQTELSPGLVRSPFQIDALWWHYWESEIKQNL